MSWSRTSASQTYHSSRLVGAEPRSTILEASSDGRASEQYKKFSNDQSIDLVDTLNSMNSLHTVPVDIGSIGSDR
jgi:hypothetical protein